MSGIRLVPITPEQRAWIVWLLMQANAKDNGFVSAYDAAPEPIPAWLCPKCGETSTKPRDCFASGCKVSEYNTRSGVTTFFGEPMQPGYWVPR